MLPHGHLHMTTWHQLKKGLTDKWLKCELHRWYGWQNVTTRLLMMVHLKLEKELSPNDFDNLAQEV